VRQHVRDATEARPDHGLNEAELSQGNGRRISDSERTPYRAGSEKHAEVGISTLVA
jgi:hypothetical protein